MTLKNSFHSIRNRCLTAAVLVVFTLLCIALEGCVTNDDSLMPWASPAPGEGTIPLPSSLLRE